MPRLPTSSPDFTSLCHYTTTTYSCGHISSSDFPTITHVPACLFQTGLLSCTRMADRAREVASESMCGECEMKSFGRRWNIPDDDKREEEGENRNGWSDNREPKEKGLGGTSKILTEVERMEIKKRKREFEEGMRLIEEDLRELRLNPPHVDIGPENSSSPDATKADHAQSIVKADSKNGNGIVKEQGSMKEPLDPENGIEKNNPREKQQTPETNPKWVRIHSCPSLDNGCPASSISTSTSTLKSWLPFSYSIFTSPSLSPTPIITTPKRISNPITTLSETNSNSISTPERELGLGKDVEGETEGEGEGEWGAISLAEIRDENDGDRDIERKEKKVSFDAEQKGDSDKREGTEGRIEGAWIKLTEDADWDIVAA